MPSYYRDYDVEDDEGNFAYCNRDPLEDTSRSSPRVFDDSSCLRVPLRTYDIRCRICLDRNCSQSHRWFTREGFLCIVGLGGLSQPRPIPDLQAAVEQAYGQSRHGWNRCEVCAESTVFRRDREEASDCILPHRLFTWEGYVWYLVGEYGGDSPENRLRAREAADEEWDINGGICEPSRFERAARAEQRGFEPTSRSSRLSTFSSRYRSSRDREESQHPSGSRYYENEQYPTNSRDREDEQYARGYSERTSDYGSSGRSTHDSSRRDRFDEDYFSCYFRDRFRF